MMLVYYFGCWTGERGDGGHFLRTPDGFTVRMSRLSRLRPNEFPLRENAIDGLFAGPDDPQSVCVLVHVHAAKDWTILQCADYTGDSRPGSNSSLVAEGEHSASEMEALWKQHFPAQYERITKVAPLRLAKGAAS